MEYKKAYSGKGIFEGYVLIKVPSYVERMENLKEMNFNISENGDVEINEATYESLVKMGVAAKKFCITMELVHKKTKKKFNSLEELEPYSEYQEIVTDIVSIVAQGVSLGN